MKKKKILKPAVKRREADRFVQSCCSGEDFETRCRLRKVVDGEICLLHRCCITSERLQVPHDCRETLREREFSRGKRHKAIHRFNVKIAAVRKVYASEETRLLIPTRQKELAACHPNT